MNRAEADKLVGKRVSAWTSANGVYVGTLVEVLPRRPWRGKVLVDGIQSPAVCWEQGRGFRRGVRAGDVIEVGGTNIEPTDAVCTTDYIGLMEAEADRFEADFRSYMAGAHGDPSDTRVAKLYAWRQRAAEDVRSAIARLRYEALPVEEAVEVEVSGDMVSLRIQPDDAVEQALWNLPRPRARRETEPGRWTVPLELVDILRDRLAETPGDTSRVLLARLGDAPRPPSP